MAKKESKAINDLSESFEDMFETAEAVKGEAFAQFVGFLVNSQSIIKIIAMACEESIEEGSYVLADEKHPLRKTITRILNQSISMYGDALGLPEKELKEAVDFAMKMQEKIDQAEDALMDEEEEDDGEK